MRVIAGMGITYVIYEDLGKWIDEVNVLTCYPGGGGGIIADKKQVSYILGLGQ